MLPYITLDKTPYPLRRMSKVMVPFSTMGKVQTPGGASMETSRPDLSKATTLVECAITPPCVSSRPRVCYHTPVCAITPPLLWRNSAQKFVPGGVLPIQTTINTTSNSVLHGSSLLEKGGKLVSLGTYQTWRGKVSVSGCSITFTVASLAGGNGSDVCGFLYSLAGLPNKRLRDAKLPSEASARAW